MFGILSTSQFTQIKDDIAACHTQLIICDFNGVLDNYYQCKYDYLRNVLGDEYTEHLANLAVATDIAYRRNPSVSLEESIEKYIKEHGLTLTPSAKDCIATGMTRPNLTSSARTFIREVAPTTLVVYTAQPQAVVDEYKTSLSSVDWISAQQLGHPKPSIENLEELMRRYSVTADQVCVIGDGLIDDLMPAKLLGMHTILVSPFTDMLLHPAG